MLERLGYDTEVVSSGPEAIKALKHNHYDLVLMDLVMPEMDGLDAAREIKRLWPDDLRIVGITAYAVPGTREMCLAAGMNDCITKPVSIGELRKVLKMYALGA